MIHSVMIFNAAGKPRLTKFYTPHPPSDRLAQVQRIYELLSSRPDSLCNFVELPRAEFDGFGQSQSRSRRRGARTVDRTAGSKGKGKGKAKAKAKAEAQYEEYDEYEEERRQGGQAHAQAASRAGYSDIGGSGEASAGGSSGTDDDDDDGDYVDMDTLDGSGDGDGAHDGGRGGGGEVLRVIYRHYATLYFVFCVDEAESELGILDLIQVFVESLDRCFENVCELDLIFNYDSVQTLLNCLIVGGYVQDTAIDSIASLFRQQMAARKASVQSESLTAGLPEINLASLSGATAGMGMGGAAGVMGGVGSWTDRLTRGLGRGRLGR